MISYPQTFLSGPMGAQRVYTIQPDRACLTGSEVVDDIASDTKVIAEIRAFGTLVAASPGRILELLGNNLAVPAYGLDSGPASFVPSGRVFIRLASNLVVSDFQTTLKDSGFVIAEPHSHFAFAAWLKSNTDEIADEISDALDRCETLMTIPGIESCEPEMLAAMRQTV